MLSGSNRALVRWHGWGLAFGTLFASAATLPLLILTDHPGGTLGEFLWKVPAMWFGIFFVLSPLLLAVLIVWRTLARRYAAVEQHRVLRWIVLLLLANVVAACTHTVLAIYAATTEPIFDWTYVWYRIVTDAGFFGLIVIGSVGWLVVPRLRVRVVLDEFCAGAASLTPKNRAT